MANASVNEDLISVLNDLIETCRDAESGFRTAAEGVKEARWRTMFDAFARQRAHFAAELQQEIIRLGGRPERSGGGAGVLHRGWIDIKAAVSGGSEPAIVSEAERSEDQAVKSYREAMGVKLPAGTKELVERQFRQVLDAHDRIRSIEQPRRAA